jgi:hypothetical protein
MTTEWTDNTRSNTTARNTSRFVLLSKMTRNDGVNLQPAYRSSAQNGRGVGFYWTTTDPVRFHTSGESTI